MKNNLEISKQQLIERWIEAFDEFDQFKKYEDEVVEVKYSDDNDAYNIQNYKSGKLKSKRKLLKEPRGNTYCEFGFNKNKLPVISILFNSNIVGWIGFYKWNKDLIEYVEFCYSNHVPSALHRLILKDDKKISLQSITLNGRGSYPIFSSMSKEEIIKHALKHTNTLIMGIKNYKYSNDEIVNVNGLASLPGIGEYTYEDVYSYDDKVSLNKIERFTESWPPQLIYIKPSGKKIEKLIEELSSLLSSEIIDAFDKEKIGESIFNVQLNYHAIDNYWPYITMITEQEKNDALKNKTNLLFLDHIAIANDVLRENRSEKLKEMFAEFDQYIQSKEDWKKGDELLIKTSRIITENKLKGKVPVSNDFIVFATDWSMNYDIEETLLKCGASKKNVKQWKDLNWF